MVQSCRYCKGNAGTFEVKDGIRWHTPEHGEKHNADQLSLGTVTGPTDPSPVLKIQGPRPESAEGGGNGRT